MTTKLQRWDLCSSGGQQGSEAEAVADSDGDWVRYSDLMALVKEEIHIVDYQGDWGWRDLSDADAEELRTCDRRKIIYLEE